MIWLQYLMEKSNFLITDGLDYQFLVIGGKELGSTSARIVHRLWRLHNQ